MVTTVKHYPNNVKLIFSYTRCDACTDYVMIAP